MNTAYYSEKDKNYFSFLRLDVIGLLPVDPKQKILEVGAGGCNMLLHIKENGIAGEVMGVELMRIPGSNQDNKMIDKFQVADIEKENIDKKTKLEMDLKLAGQIKIDDNYFYETYNIPLPKKENLKNGIRTVS